MRQRLPDLGTLVDNQAHFAPAATVDGATAAASAVHRGTALERLGGSRHGVTGELSFVRVLAPVGVMSGVGWRDCLGPACAVLRRAGPDSDRVEQAEQEWHLRTPSE